MSYVIRHGTVYLERNPACGDWRWDAGSTKYASRFSLAGATVMLGRLKDAGIPDAIVCGAGQLDNETTSEQIATGDINPIPDGFNREHDLNDLRR